MEAHPRGDGDGPLHVAIAYDCLFPFTVGGAERWYRALAEELVERGHAVTYLTRRQWDGPAPAIHGVDVVAVSPADDLYDGDGGRRVGPTLRYGAGILRHLRGHRGRYDIVHTANFPFWSVLAARAALVGGGVPVVVDWHEVWSWAFWRSYTGQLSGTVGFGVQRLCIAASRHPVVTSEHNAARFLGAGGRQPLVLPGYFPDPAPTATDVQSSAAEPPYVLFAGRHISDKGVDLVPAFARALRDKGSPLVVVVAGDGPQRSLVEAALARDGLTGSVRMVGFVDDKALRDLMSAATCIVVPSRREGYGMVVVEAASLGVPVAVAAFPENLAVHHVDRGVNGFVASPDAASLADAAIAAQHAGGALRRSTLAWFEQRATTSTMKHSLAATEALHLRLARRDPDREAEAAGAAR